MKRNHLIAALAAALVLGLAVVPLVLRQLGTFNVRRVEVRGTRYLAPHEALRASGITRAANIFDDFSVWRDSLERHPLIASARIEREWPSTIRLLIEEADPIALVAGTSSPLQPIAADGQLLPIDPTRLDLDLPVIAGPSISPVKGKKPVASARTRRVLGVLEVIRNIEPEMYGWISEAEEVPGGLRIRLRAPVSAEALLPALPEEAQLRRLRLALADLAARKDMVRLIRIDARFRDQIVVALTPTAAS